MAACPLTSRERTCSEVKVCQFQLPTPIGRSRPLIFSRPTTPARSLAPLAGPYVTCSGPKGHYRYPETGVASVQSQEICLRLVLGKTPDLVQDPCPDNALTPPRKMTWHATCQVPGASPGSPCGRGSHTRIPLRAWAQSALRLAPDEDVVQERPLCHHCLHTIHSTRTEHQEE
jgi:hypothetical protein